MKSGEEGSLQEQRTACIICVKLRQKRILGHGTEAPKGRLNVAPG